MIILPRQARDKHRENSNKCRFLASASAPMFNDTGTNNGPTGTRGEGFTAWQANGRDGERTHTLSLSLFLSSFIFPSPSSKNDQFTTKQFRNTGDTDTEVKAEERFWFHAGKDSDSILADPEFDADASGSGGFALKPTSPAIAKLGEKKKHTFVARHFRVKHNRL